MNILNSIGLYRRFKSKYKNYDKTWVKTKRRGWITLSQYELYMSYGFNPRAVKRIKY